MKGEIVLVDATPDGYQEHGRTTLLGKTRQSIAIRSGRGFIRDDKEVVCVALKK